MVLSGWVWPLSSEAQENWHHVQSTVLYEYIFGSFVLMLGVAAISAIMGVSTAWLIARYDFPFRNQLSWIIILPFAIPSFIMASSYGQLLDFAGPVQSGLREVFGWSRDDYYFPSIRSYGGGAFILGLSAYPYIYMLTRAAFEAQPKEWHQLSLIYGHSQYEWVKLSLTAARPFIFVALALAVMDAAADIGVSELYGLPTLATGLYRLWYFGEDPLIAARLASFLVMIAVFLLAIERLSRSRARFSSSRSRQELTRQKLTGRKALTAFIISSLPVWLGFVIPVFWTVRLALFQTQSLYSSQLVDAISDTLLLCSIGAMATIIIALYMNVVERIYPKGNLGWLANIGYAIPSVVIALNLLVIQYYFQTQWDIRLIMTGSILGMILAYIARFYSPAYQNIHSGFARIAPEIDRMGQVFGKSRMYIFRKIHMPLIARPVLYAGLLVSIDIIKELPASLILRPFNITTLSIKFFEFARDDRQADAAPYAIILIVISLLAVYLLMKMDKRTHA